jgi:type I restriction enzyme M protein
MATQHIESLSLFDSEIEQQSSLPEIFRKIYYHLYSNSKVSRAELIIEDLSLLLLTKLSAEMNGGKEALASYLGGRGSADSVLLPMLRNEFPELLGSKQIFALNDASLRMALSDLSEVDLSKAPAHTLGEAFQALIGPRLRGEKGQFFTPKSVVRAMIEILDPKPGEDVCDPAEGTGGFLAETHIYQLQKYPHSDLNGDLIGVDKDTGLARLSGALMKILSKGRAHVYNFNSLSFDEWIEHTLKHPEGQFDVVLTNPPFGARIGIRDEAILSSFDFGHIWTASIDKKERWVRTRALSSSEDPQILFLELCVRMLRPNGRMGIVLPEGVFGNKQTAYVWDWLENQGSITALLDCPRTTFQPGTDTKTNILFFQKTGVSQLDARPQTKIAVALNCGHDRRGRAYTSKGQPYPDDFLSISKSIHTAHAPENWRSVSLHGVRYLVPRYYYDIEEVTLLEKQLTSGARVATLGELVKERILTIRKGHEVGSEFYGTGDVPFVRTSDISNFEISSDPTKSVSDEIYESFSDQQKLKAGDTLIVVDGRYRIGSTAMITEHNVRCVVQSHLRILSVLKPQKLDPYALLFALNLPSVKLRIRSLVFIQSTLGTLGNRINELRIPVLQGDGSWASRLERFKVTLQRRADLLADLKAMSGPDYEL